MYISLVCTNHCSLYPNSIGTFMALSDLWLKPNNGKQRKKVEVVTDRDSLSVRISPKGKIVFQCRYRVNAQSKRMDIGAYPLLSLKDARIQVQSYKAELDQGKRLLLIEA